MGNALSAFGHPWVPHQEDHPKPEAHEKPHFNVPDVFPGAATAEPAPVQGTDKSLSKRAQKRQLKEERFRARKKVRRAVEKTIRKQRKKERKSERLEALAHCDPEERERILKERIDIMRAGRVAERAKREHVRQLIANARKYAVCIDLGWNAQMTEKERKSLARQLTYSYSALRKSVEEGLQPLALSIVGLDGLMKPKLTSAAAGWESWPVTLSEKSLQEVHGKRKLVYLTHDSEHIVEELDEDCVYVIGGIVDRNRLKGATALKAREMGIATARFNMDEIVQMEHGTRVLTVNHCVEILLQVANGMSWKDAYMKVLPERKGLASSIDGAT